MIAVANVIEDGRLAGPQIRIAEVAAYLRDRGITTVAVIPERESGPFKARLAAARVEYCALPLHRPERRLPGFLLYLVWFPWEVFLLYLHFRRRKYHLVHCSGGAWQVKGVIAAWLSGSRVIWHLNDSAMPWYIRMSFRLFSQMADVLIVAGRRVKDYYVGHFSISAPIVEIQAPVNCAAFDPKRVVRSNHLLSGTLNIVTVANVNPLKGIEYFIDMASRLTLRANRRLEFHVVGPIYESQTAYAKHLRAMAVNRKLGNLHFLGPSSDVARILAATDIYVCSSVAEASPIAVWEAMSMERAIVSTDVGDVGRFLVNGVAGYVVPPGDGEELARAVEALASDSALRERFGMKAREVALQNLDIAICAAKHMEAYSLVIGSAHSQPGT